VATNPWQLRGTGKSTWIRQHFGEAVYYDLLNTSEALRLERNPHQIARELEALKPESWVVIDEVQKVPALLDEVHRLIEECGLRFILCGSSARKLKRGGANLLAGRALMAHMHPLLSTEMGEAYDVEAAMVLGGLPRAVAAPDAKAFLLTYAELYLNEEIRMEALTRNVGGFSRFLEVAARQNGQVTNVSNIARDAGVGRTTVQNYFEILVDTLIGHWMHPWKLKRATKQVALARLREELAPREVRTFGVYRGSRPARHGQLDVLPARDFLYRLWQGDIY